MTNTDPDIRRKAEEIIFGMWDTLTEDERKVVLKENIKALGVFEIEIKVYAGISAKVKVNIVKAND